MRKIKFTLPTIGLIAIFFLTTSLFTACSKDENGNPNGHNVRYEVTGNITVPVTIQYTPTVDENGDFDDDYEVTTNLPWEKDVVIAYNASGAGCNVSADDASPGQQVTVKIFEEGKEVINHKSVVDAEGNLQISLNHVFKR